MLIKISITNFIHDSGLLIDKESIRISGETSVKLTKIKAIVELTLDILFFFGAIIELAYGKKPGQTVKNNVFDDIEDEIEIHSGFTKFAAYVFVVYAMINFITLMAILMKKPSMLIGECYFKLLQFTIIMIFFVAVFLVLLVDVVFACFMIRLMEASLGVFSLIMNFFLMFGILNYAVWSYQVLVMAKRHMEQQNESIPYMSASNTLFNEDSISTSMNAPLNENLAA